MGILVADQVDVLCDFHVVRVIVCAAVVVGFQKAHIAVHGEVLVVFQDVDVAGHAVVLVAVDAPRHTRGLGLQRACGPAPWGPRGSASSWPPGPPRSQSVVELEVLDAGAIPVNVQGPI